jgi:hypothetical protein
VQQIKDVHETNLAQMEQLKQLRVAHDALAASAHVKDNQEILMHVESNNRHTES